MTIQGDRIQKANKKSLNAKGKGKGKGNVKDKSHIPKPKNPKPSAKELPKKDDACHHCKEVGHWKRNCHVYLAEFIKKKKQLGTANSSSIFTIELFSFLNKSWVYNTGCDYGISLSKNDVLYFNAIPSNGIYKIDLNNLVSNVFKNEVENQLEKTIKALRSDRGGEYISQEFKDYLKGCGIVQQLTPPYTPQHNKVSERRNRTLLYMVRSMTNRTTLPLSFWDYALESATRILNMVPTKKVDKTPYEFWIPKETMGYYFYLPPENKIDVARYAEFFKKNLISQEISGRAVELEEINEVSFYTHFRGHLTLKSYIYALNRHGQDYGPTPTSLKNFYSAAGDGVTDYT
nr:hypothetical protein [Tanacetum cinerariifolium]